MALQLFKEAILVLVVSAAYSKSKIRTFQQKIHIQHKHTIHFQSHKSEYQPYHLINYLQINTLFFQTYSICTSKSGHRFPKTALYIMPVHIYFFFKFSNLYCTEVVYKYWCFRYTCI